MKNMFLTNKQKSDLNLSAGPFFVASPRTLQEAPLKDKTMTGPVEE